MTQLEPTYRNANDLFSWLHIKPRGNNSNELDYIEVKGYAGGSNIGIGGLLKVGKVLPNIDGCKVVSDRFVEVSNA